MFRKTKNKSAIRQRQVMTDDQEIESKEKADEPPKQEQNDPGSGDEEPVTMASKNTLLSFATDEDESEGFRLKKDKKKIKEVRLQKKLERHAKEVQIKQEVVEVDEIEFKIIETKPIKVNQIDEQKIRKNEAYERVTQIKEQEMSEEEADGHIFQQPHHTSMGQIPDSKAVYEARKRRERLRAQGHDGYIPLDDDQKIREKGSQRLIREDENDDSDEDAEKFYSSREIAMEEDNARRELQNQFLEHEEGSPAESDDEIDRWERQQILKAVGASTIGQMKHEYEITTQFFKKIREEDEERVRPIEMDVDMDLENVPPTSTSNEPSASQVTMGDLLNRLGLRMRDREESLNALRQNMETLETHISENETQINKLESSNEPKGSVSHQLSEKYKMYQEMKIYFRSLLDCLNDKMVDINSLIDKKRNIERARMERLILRRRRDIRDSYDECAAAAAGKNIAMIKAGDHGVRAAEREARRGRRRREREGNLQGISHEEGLSTDDEETTSRIVADNEARDEVIAIAKTIFGDTLDDYSRIARILERITFWLTIDEKSFQNAYIQLFIPKLLSPFIRLELIQADILKDSNFRLEMQEWYRELLMVGHSKLDSEHPILVGLIPSVIEKVVIPFLTDLINDEWDPLSLKQTRILANFLETLIQDYPSITEKSKSMQRLVEAIRQKTKISQDEDLFIPMYSKQSIENPNTGCRAFLDRQFWTSIKLIRCLSLFSKLFAPCTMHQLIFEGILAPSCGLALQMGEINEPSTLKKVRAIITETNIEWMPFMNQKSMLSLIGILSKISEEYEKNNKEFSKQVRRYVDRLKRAE